MNVNLLNKANKTFYSKKIKKGLSRKTVDEISKDLKEPAWMKTLRLNCLKTFFEKDMPKWGPDLSALDLNEIIYYAKPGEVKNTHSWEQVPKEIKKTFEILGIPEAERRFLAGAGAQYESLTVYHKLKEEWKNKGVIFEDMVCAVKKYPELVKKYFMKAVSASEHKFAALHGAVWSGGTFIYIPDGVNLSMPLQAYFRMNAKNMGQFEHTLIIAGKNANGSYIEGCSAPKYETPSLHAGMVEIFLEEGARFRYSSVENWSRNTYNLNTKRAIVGANAVMEWIGGNFGSKCTMLYPCSILKGEGGRADHLSIAFAGKGQIQDTGAKVIHAAARTSSKIVTKSISKDGGACSYRGLINILPGSSGAKAHSRCDALILDSKSSADTTPSLKVAQNDVSVGHEATVGKISEEQMYYCQSRGISEDEAVSMIVNGFIEPVVKELPLEYAVEMNRLIELEMKEAGAIA